MSLITLHTEPMRVTINPDEGGRIVELLDVQTGEEWLQRGRTKYQMTPSAASFRDGAWGGFDECFPSIAACQHPDRPPGHTTVSDHGEVWSRPWRMVEQSDHSLTLDTRDIDYPVVMSRRVDLDVRVAGVTLTYRLENVSHERFRFVYSAHPLFWLPAAATIQLPAGSDTITGFGSRLAPRTRSRWPHVPTPLDAPIDFSMVHPQPAPRSEKVFVRSQGWCRLQLPGAHRSLLLLQHPDDLPWLGICVNHGQWPSPDIGQHWIALEPTTSPFDNLVEAAGRGMARTLAPNQTAGWKIRIELEAEERDQTSIGCWEALTEPCE